MYPGKPNTGILFPKPGFLCPKSGYFCKKLHFLSPSFNIAINSFEAEMYEDRCNLHILWSVFFLFSVLVLFITAVLKISLPSLFVAADRGQNGCCLTEEFLSGKIVNLNIH